MPSIKKKFVKKINEFHKDFGKIGFWTIVAVVMPIIGLSVFIGTIYKVSPWLEANPKIGVPAFIISIAILSGLAILPTNIVGMTSGWAFGFPLGLFTMLSAIAGAVTINFFVSRKIGRKNFKHLLNEKPKLKAIHEALLDSNFAKVVTIIILLRLSPATPFAATNFMLSASGVPMKSYISGTILAYIPRTAATVFVGSSLSRLNFDQPSESWILILGIIATIVTTIVIGVLSKRALNRLTDEKISTY